MRFYFLVFFVLISIVTFSQGKSDMIQQRIEFIGEQLEMEEVDLTTVFDQLNYYFDHPLNLNFASIDELQSLGLLSDIQIKNLELHVKIHGKLMSIFELQSLKYWDLSTIELVLPFVRVDEKMDQTQFNFKDVIKNGNYELYARYQTITQSKSGYSVVPDSVKLKSNSYYLGNKDHYYSRFRYSYRTNLSIGITADKDPGEQFFKGAAKSGFDFYSVHAFYTGGKYIKSVVLGDYQIQIGQGLNFWSGFAFGKTSDVTNIKKSAIPIRPYTSADESHFLRGGAIDFGFKNFSLLTFASNKKMDAIVNFDTNFIDNRFISSIQTSGLHRTNSEIVRKNQVKEQIAGVNLRYKVRNFSCGLATVYQGYTYFYSKQSQPYNQFDFRGKEFTSVSGDYTWLLKNMNFFGEISRSSFSGGLAQIHGVLIALDPKASLSVVYRDYGKDYQTFYNNGFAEGSSTKNEKGIYAGLKLKLFNSFMLNTYMDYFSFPWLKYQVDKPSIGHEFLTQLTYKPSKVLEIYGRFREQLHQKNSRNSDGSIVEIEDVIQRNYRLNMSYSISEAVTLKSRVEFVTIHRSSNQTEQGMVLSQDIQYKPKTLPFDIYLRYSLFQTDSYDSRIYIYESNAANVFTIPAYFYKGSRAYCMIRYTCLSKIDIWLRYGSTIFSDLKSIGTGSEKIKGSSKSDFLIQIRMRL